MDSTIFNETPIDTPVQNTPVNGMQKKIIVIGAIVVGAFALAGGGYFAYSQFFYSPEKVFAKMFEHMPSIKTYEYSGKIQAELAGLSIPIPGLTAEKAQEQDSKKHTYILSMAGAVDATKPESPQARMALNVAEDDSSKQPELEKNGTATRSVLIGLETRMKDKTLFVSLKNAPNIPLFDLSTLEDQWFKIGMDESETKQLTSGMSMKTPEVTADQQKQLQDLVTKEKYFSLTRGNEKLAGVNAYHIVIHMTRDGVKKYLDRVKTILNDEQFPKDSRDAFDKAIQDYIPADKPLSVDVWVGKKDYYPYQFRTQFTIPKTDESSIAGTVNVSSQLKNINKPVSIETPTDVKKIEDVFGSLFGGGVTAPQPGAPISSDPALQSPSDASLIDADNDGLSDEQEKTLGTDPNKTDSDADELSDSDEVNTYKTDPLKADTDGDTFKDGAEIKNGYNPLGKGKILKEKPADVVVEVK